MQQWSIVSELAWHAGRATLPAADLHVGRRMWAAELGGCAYACGRRPGEVERGA